MHANGTNKPCIILSGQHGVIVSTVDTFHRVTGKFHSKNHFDLEAQSLEINFTSILCEKGKVLTDINNVMSCNVLTDTHT